MALRLGPVAPLAGGSFGGYLLALLAQTFREAPLRADPFICELTGAYTEELLIELLSRVAPGGALVVLILSALCCVSFLVGCCLGYVLGRWPGLLFDTARVIQTPAAKRSALEGYRVA